jgi:hypothetical protein
MQVMFLLTLRQSKYIAVIFLSRGLYRGGNSSLSTPFSDGYSESGSVPLSNSVSNGSGQTLTQAQSSAGFFSVSASAWASFVAMELPSASALAVADVVFQPLSPMAQLTIYYQGDYGVDGGYSGNMVLKDLTSGIQIFSQAVPQPLLYCPPGPNCDGGSDLINYPFQTNDVYELYLSAQANTEYDPDSLIIGTNNISAVVPEPATMLLLGLGLVGLAGARRKFKN